MTRFKFLLFVALLVGFAALAHVGLDDGRAAYDKGDYAQAYEEFKAAAEQGNIEAQYMLGSMYYEGKGVLQDYSEALKWYRKAAEQGDAKAQLGLGNMYGKGNGAPQDYAEAAKWYQKAAVQGDARAQKTLGGMYWAGQGVQQDFVQAHMWFNLAAAQGLPGAQDLRDEIAHIMTPAQIAEAKRLAKEWKPKGRD